MRLFVMLGVLVLSGCVGVGIVATSDPMAKLHDAADLFMRQDRPLPAERLIREAIEIFQERNDSHGLGHAHRDYGDLLRSPAIVRWEKVYRRDGFRDKSITFENRHQKSSEFFQRALEYYGQAVQQLKQASKYDALTNVYFNMAWTNYKLDRRDAACIDFTRAVQAHSENVRLNPTAKPYVPPGSGSFAEFIDGQKRRVGC